MTCVCMDALGESSWYNVLKFVAPAPPGNIFMNFYIQRVLSNESLQECGMNRPLRGRVNHDGRSAFVCEGQLPFYNSNKRIPECLNGIGLTKGAIANREFLVLFRDEFGLVEAALCWSPGFVPKEHAWVTIGYDVQKWKVFGDTIHKSTCHPIPPLCKMIAEICYSFPLYKYCLFANLNVAVPQRWWGLDDEWSALFRFSTVEEAAKCIDSSQDFNPHGIRLLRIENLNVKRKIVPLGWAGPVAGCFRYDAMADDSMAVDAMAAA